MLETIVIWLIIAACAYFVGARLYRQLRAATDPNKSVSCGCECSGCSTSGCDSNTTPTKE